MAKHNAHRLMTLNTHSLLEKDTAFCLKTLTEVLLSEKADILCLQEINQPMEAAPFSAELLPPLGYVPCDSGMPVREGNWAVLLAQSLQKAGVSLYWTWCYTHCGYGRFDEGVAIFSTQPISRTVVRDLSMPGAECARWLLGVEVNGERFFTVHLGWWKDEKDPLRDQLARIFETTAGYGGVQYLMGDFNSPAHIRGEGYDTVLAAGWTDCYTAATEKDDGITVGGAIDGWRKGKVDPMRIDFCFVSQPVPVESSRVIFNDCFHPVISDHSGVFTLIGDE